MIKLIGFEHQINILISNYASQNLHSSIIIHGPKGIGKKIFIKKLLSEIFKSNLNENNYLHHVNLLNKDTHPNVRNVEKIFDNRSKKIKSEISIDQIRNLKNFVNETSSIQDLNKFIIIDSADDLNINSSNSLLKILEEPKKDTFIFLISHQISSLIPTIRSRCLKIKLNKHEYNNFKNIVSSQIDNITEDEIKFLYDISNGSPGDSIMLYENNIIEMFDLTINSLSNLKTDYYSIELANILTNMDNENFKSYLSLLKSMLVIMNKLKYENFLPTNYLSNQFKILKNISIKLTSKNIIDRFDFLSKNEKDLFTYNFDKRLFILNFLNS